MIVKLDSSYHKNVMNYLNIEPEFNLLIIGDVEKYGYDNRFFNVWANINKKGNIEGILVKYFEFITFYYYDKCEVNLFIDLINRLDYSEISGKQECLQQLERRLEINKKRIVNFCKLETLSGLYNDTSNIKVKKIRFGNINKVVKLYELIDEFENTTPENVKNGLKTGRGYCIEENRQVVAMAKSTSENKTHAMIVGVATHPSYRNKGYATRCLIKVCKELIEENKIPCLFYDNNEAGYVYKKIGFEQIGRWAIYNV